MTWDYNIMTWDSIWHTLYHKFPTPRYITSSTIVLLLSKLTRHSGGNLRSSHIQMPHSEYQNLKNSNKTLIHSDCSIDDLDHRRAAAPG